MFIALLKRYISTTNVMSFKIPDSQFNYNLMDTIRFNGKNLCSINLLCVASDVNNCLPMVDHFAEGCPKLKTLTIETLSLPAWNGHWDWFDITITKESLEELYTGCKELKDLKLTKVYLQEMYTEDEIKKILPDCNVETKECIFEPGPPPLPGSESNSWMSEDSNSMEEELN